MTNSNSISATPLTPSTIGLAVSTNNINPVLTAPIDTILFNDEMNLPPAFKKKMLAEELNLSEDDEIMNYMSLLFSKRLMINTIIECTDEYAREDIIYNQNFWRENRVCGINLN